MRREGWRQERGKGGWRHEVKEGGWRKRRVGRGRREVGG